MDQKEKPCSSYQSKLKAIKVPDVSKLYKKVNKLLYPHEPNPTFVPSTSSRSSSQDSGVPPPYPENDLLGSAFAPPPPIHNTNQYQTNPMPYGWALNGITGDGNQPGSSSSTGMLSLDIGVGNETAGSGFDYFQEQQSGEASDNEIYIERQKAHLEQFNSFIEKEHQRVLDMAKKQDNYDIWYQNRYAGVEKKNVIELEAQVAELEYELSEMRRKDPNIMPPRPPPPRSQSQEICSRTWTCLGCRNENSIVAYDCIKCGIPGNLINPEEAARCKCIYCNRN